MGSSWRWGLGLCINYGLAVGGGFGDGLLPGFGVCSGEPHDLAAVGGKVGVAEVAECPAASAFWLSAMTEPVLACVHTHLVFVDRFHCCGLLFGVDFCIAKVINYFKTRNFI